MGAFGLAHDPWAAEALNLCQSYRKGE